MALAAVPIAISVVGGAMSMMAANASAKGMQSTSAEYRQQAMLTDLQAKQDEASRLDQLTRALGHNTAAAGAQNIAIDSESVEATQEGLKADVARQIGLNRVGAQVEENRLMTGSEQMTSAAASQQTSGLLKMGTSIFGGASDYLTKTTSGAKLATAWGLS